MKHTNKTIAILLLAALAHCGTAACKKPKNETGGSNSAGTEKLGDLKPGLYSSIFFTKDGQPAVQYADYFYEWNASAKKWQKFAGKAPGGGFSTMVQDKQGNYYGISSLHIYMHNKTTDSWDSLQVGNYRNSNNAPSLITNRAGDIVIRMGVADTSFYFRKAAMETKWTKIAQRMRSEEAHSFPYYLCDNGNLYFSYDITPFPRGVLCAVVLNTNTGGFGMLYDRSDIDNGVVLGGSSNAGIISGAYINANGMVYVMNENYKESTVSLYRLTPASLPAKFELVQKLTLPTMSENTSGWVTGVSTPFTINSKGEIKMVLGCSKYPDAHYAQGIASLKDPEIKYFNHGQSQQQICPNLNGDAYIAMFDGYIYKW